MLFALRFAAHVQAAVQPLLRRKPWQGAAVSPRRNMHYPSKARSGYAGNGANDNVDVNPANIPLPPDDIAHECCSPDEPFRDRELAPKAVKLSTNEQVSVRGSQTRSRRTKRHSKQIPVQESKVEPDGHRASVEGMKRELDALRKEKDSIKQSLRACSDELQSARAYMVTADKTSLADVLVAVDHLNAEILQTAASVADKWSYRTDDNEKDNVREREEKDAADRLRRTIDRRLMGMLRTGRHDEDPYRVQIALQSCLALHATGMCARWGTALGENQGCYMQTVYGKLKESEISSVCRRWRALSYRFGREVGTKVDRPEIVLTIAAQLRDILLVSGVESGSKDLLSSVMESFAARIEVMIQKVTSLQRVFCEDVVSCDLHLDVPRPGDKQFDAAQMEDIGGPVPKRTPRDVLCTVDVGLMSIKEVNGAAQTTTLLKAKVVSDLMVQELLRAGKKQRQQHSSQKPEDQAASGHRYNHHSRRNKLRAFDD